MVGWSWSQITAVAIIQLIKEYVLLIWYLKNLNNNTVSFMTKCSVSANLSVLLKYDVVLKCYPSHQSLLHKSIPGEELYQIFIA